MSFLEKRQIYFYTILTCFFCLMGVFQLTKLEAQTPKIRLSSQEISTQDMFEISVTVSEPIRNYKGFPKIDGFIQFRKDKGERLAVLNGKAIRMSTLKVLYRPLQTGTFQVPAFKVTINGKSVRQKGFKITVKKEGEIQDPMLRNMNDEPIEFVELKADVFFDITSNKKSVMVGEGFNVVMAIYVRKEDIDKVDFPNDLDEQIGTLLKKIKPKNCWEENFGIMRPIDKEVIIRGKRYWQYKVFQATFFPFNTDKIIIPSVPLDILRVKMARMPSAPMPIVRNVRKTYHSKEKTITVQALPTHPLSTEASVGRYELQERIQFAKVKGKERTTETGKNFAYVLRIRGEGNISAIRAPQPISNEYFEFYPYSVAAERIEHEQNSVYGYRDFRYNIIPKKAGKYHLGDYISWVYFNTQTQKYDTLHSKIQFEAIGDEVAIYQADSLQTGLYTEIKTDNQLISIHKRSNVDLVANVSLLILLSLTAFLTFKK